MTVESLQVSLDAVDELFGYEAACALVAADERPLGGALGLIDWRLCGALSRVVASGFFAGDASERLLLPTDGRIPPGRLFVVGLGRAARVTAEGLEAELCRTRDMLAQAAVSSVALAVSRLPGLVGESWPALVQRVFGVGPIGRIGVFGP